MGFYEMVRSIDLLGTVKHFEALICATATLGWFGLLSFVLSVCGAVGEMLHGNGRVFTVCGAIGVAVGMLCKIHIPQVILLASGAVFWVFLPILTQGIDARKKRKKSQIPS